VKTEDEVVKWLGSLRAGRAACLFSDDVEDSRDVLLELVASQPDAARVVTLTWREVPPLANELGLLVDALARTALELFPSLYGLTQAGSGRWSHAEVETDAHAIARRVPGVLGAACRTILWDCRRGEPPNLGKLPSGEKVRQLALAIDPERLVILIAVGAPPAHDERLQALAQGAEWLATNADARVVLVLPKELAGRPELDHVAYTTEVHGAPEPRATPGPPPSGAFAEPHEPAESSNESALAPEISYSPVTGRPAPNSDAEKLLFERLTGDPELRPLFSYNQRVATRFPLVPTVDLLCGTWKLVFEIDGDDHRGPQKYWNDRRRDYELMMSGFRVVRISSARVLEHTDAVVEEIRQTVQYLAAAGGPR
jgi:very-short-patch-repair endonuclease